MIDAQRIKFVNKSRKSETIKQERADDEIVLNPKNRSERRLAKHILKKKKAKL